MLCCPLVLLVMLMLLVLLPVGAALEKTSYLDDSKDIVLLMVCRSLDSVVGG